MKAGLTFYACIVALVLLADPDARSTHGVVWILGVSTSVVLVLLGAGYVIERVENLREAFQSHRQYRHLVREMGEEWTHEHWGRPLDWWRP